MDCITTSPQEIILTPNKETLAKDLNLLLNTIPPGIKTLSLDCFDTLIWRKTALPSEVFYLSQEKQTHQTFGLNAIKRVEAEKKARLKQYYNNDHTEVTLNEIYNTFNPSLSKQDLKKLAEEEIEAEIESCYALPNCEKIIRIAKEKNLKVIIVSDTYLNENQLKTLLQACLKKETYQSIDLVFCSSDYKKSKQTGIFDTVLKKTACQPNEIWHIGDNPYSDFLGAQKHKILSTLLIKHKEEKIAEVFRLHTFAALLNDSRIRYQKPLNDPFLGVFSSKKEALSTPEYIIGYLSLGPIFYAFSEYIKSEVEAISQQGKNIKLIFLLRDGYLPNLAFKALTEDRYSSAPVYISRFSALASSFESKNDIDDYLYKYAHPNRFKEICTQLLLSNEERTDIINVSISAADPVKTFIELIHQNKRMNKIYKASEKYRKRLYSHIQKNIKLEANDTLMLVDLGYTGTAQNCLTRFFKKELNIDTVGRYLIACNTHDSDDTRKGMLDSSHFDDKLLSSLITFISLFEKLCSINTESVINYSENGDPLLKKTNTKKSDYEIINTIHNKTIEFIQDCNTFNFESNIKYNISTLRDTAMAALSRLLFFPTQSEIDHLKSIEYELDMGSSDVLSVYDEKKGISGLRKRGLFFMEKKSITMRTNYPAELRYASIELSAMLLLQERLKYDLRINDFSLRRETLTLIIMSNNQAFHHKIDAIPTYDGYYSVNIPLGNNQFPIGIQFGLNYQWVQVDSIETVQLNTLYSSIESLNTNDVSAQILLDGILKHTDTLYQCTSKSGLMVYTPNEKTNNKQTLKIVFRPICNQD